MRISTLKIAGAVLAAGLVAQTASAVLVTNQVRAVKGVGVRINFATPPSFVTGYDKVSMRCDSAGQSGKSWLAWDLSGTWAFYGQTNLTNASLTIWGENGTARSFNVAALKDSLGLDGWDQTTLHWSNAPANVAVNLDSEPDPGSTVARQQLDWTKINGATNLWAANGGGVDLARADLGGNFDQCARYTSPNGTVNSNLTAFLKTDTDGLITLIGVGGNNQNWQVGTNGFYTNDIALGYTSINPATLGDQIRDTPTLTLVFDVRVGMTGGGLTCAGGSGIGVGLAGSDVGISYLLYTNNAYAGVTVPGTGSAVSFGLFNTPGLYTAVSSNITTSVTNAVAGVVGVGLIAAPVITAQPTSFVAATNSVALYSVTATGLNLGYKWYRNGVALSDGPHYTGTSANQLIISPVLASDAATTANGYYCVVTNTCGDQIVSVTNALTIQTARNLVWRGSPSNTWNIATTPNWFNSGSSLDDVFNQGDNVLLDDTALNTAVSLASPYLSPGTITFNASGAMTISGSGNIAGPASSLLVNGNGSSTLTIANANSFAGGTTLNDGWVVVNNLGALGSGTVNLTGTGLSKLQTTAGGGPNFGLPGLNVTADSILQYDSGGAYAGSVVGPVTGTAGKTLTLQRTSGTSGDNFRLWHTNFTCDLNIYLNIGSARFAPYNASGTQVYNGVISGSGELFTRNGGGIVILNGTNTYTGGSLLSLGTVGVGIDSANDLSSGPFGIGSVVIEGSGHIGLFASGGPRIIGNSFTYQNVTALVNLIINGSNQLTLSGAFDLSASGATSGTNRVIQVDNTAPTILSGAISDQGLACSLTKTGNGVLYLDGANTYTGPTTNSAGRLAGAGSIAGPVVVGAGGVLGGGPATNIGTLTVNSDLTFNGGAFIRVNKSLSPAQSNDVVSVSGSLANLGTGTVTVTNLGPALQVGNKFTLFSQPLVNGNTMSITGAGVTWTNMLAVDGSIAVLSTTTIASYPTNLSFSVAGNTLNISWPATHLGWILQNQTNALSAGLRTNWVDVAGSSSATATNITISPANPSVFYRLRHP